MNKPINIILSNVNLRLESPVSIQDQVAMSLQEYSWKSVFDSIEYHRKSARTLYMAGYISQDEYNSILGKLKTQVTSIITMVVSRGNVESKAA